MKPRYERKHALKKIDTRIRAMNARTRTPASNEDGERNPESALAELRADTQRILEEMHQHPDDCGCAGCSGDPTAEQEAEDEYNQHLKPDQR